MSTFNSSTPDVLTRFLTNRFLLPSTNLLTGTSLPEMQGVVPVFMVPILNSPAGTARHTAAVTPPPVADTFSTYTPTPLGDLWFDIVHILPRGFVLGNILTTLNRTLEIYNASLTNPRVVVQFINNAGAGISIINYFQYNNNGSPITVAGAPPFPYNLPAQESLLMTLEITPDGAPTINTTLDFEIDQPYLLQVPIQGTRIVMFPFEPEAPLLEKLIFLTDVMEGVDGTEQRVSLRLAPRQEFVMKLIREDGPERQKVDFLLFDWQSRVFGLPIWTEPSYVTSAVTAGQTSVSVDDTSLGDFRANGLAIVYESEDKFDALEVQSVGPTVVNFKTPILNNYDIGTRVMPLRTAITTTPAQEKKYAVNLAQFDITMQVLDNDVDLSSTSGWPTYNGKVLLNDPNAIELTLDGNITRQVVVFDGSGTGKFSQTSTQNRARHGSAKTFITRTRSALWSVRRLLHALRGRQVSFYLPTFTKDITLQTTYLSGGSALTIVNVGYTRYAKQRTPKVDINIILNNGTTFQRTITGSSEVSPTVEQLTLSASIGQNIAPSDVKRIEFYEKVRIDNEEITIEHRSSNGEAKVGFPVKVVLE